MPKEPPDPEALQRVGELAARAEDLSRHVLPVTAPIYRVDDRGRPELLGSSVLLELAAARFVLSAAHVLRHARDAALYVGLPMGLEQLVGQPTFLRAIGSEKERDDHVDVGVVRLAGDVWAAMPQSNFATWQDIDVRSPMAAQHAYGLVGYPASKNKRSLRGTHINAVAYRMLGMEGDERTYAAVGRDPKLNIVIGFVQEDMWRPDGQRGAPNLYGASGSGLWRFGRRVRNAAGPALLAGIAIEWHQSRHKYILGTRIHVAIGGLRDKYEDIRAFVDERLAAT